PRRRAIEAEALLDDERRPPAERNRDERPTDAEDREEREAGRQRSEPERPKPAVEGGEAVQEPEPEEEGQVDARDDDAEPRPHARVLLRAAVALAVEDVAELGRRLGVERAEVQDVGDDLENELADDRGEDDRAVAVHRLARSVRTGAAGVPTLVSQSWWTARVAPTCSRRRADAVSGKCVVLVSIRTT